MESGEESFKLMLPQQKENLEFRTSFRRSLFLQLQPSLSSLLGAYNLAYFELFLSSTCLPLPETEAIL